MALNKTDNKVVKEKSSLSEGPTISNPDEALHILRSQPDIVTLTAVLRYLHSTISAIDTFNIRLPTPKTAQLLNILIGPIFSDYSNVLLPQEFLDGKERPQVIARTKISSIFLACLSSVAGLGAVEARLRALLAHGLAAKNPSHDSASLLASRGLLNLLVALLHGRGFIWKIWTDSTKLIRDDHRRQLLWGEFLCTICMGKILSVAAETLSFINAASEEPNNECWVGDGRNFARWLGRNIAHMTLEIHAETQEDWTAVGQTLQKAFSLGYTDEIVEEVYSGILFRANADWMRMYKLLASLPHHQQRQFINSILRHLASILLSPSPVIRNESQMQTVDSRILGGAAALIAGITKDSDLLKESLLSWLEGSAGGTTNCVSLGRAVITALASDQERLGRLMEKLLHQFGDKLYIKHTPILIQEANAQLILLTAGCVHRSSPNSFLTLARSAPYLNAISNRLASSSPKSRLLGMIIGTAISNLVDPPSNRMVFSTDEMDSPEVQHFLGLTRVQTSIGHVKDISLASVTVPNSLALTKFGSESRSVASKRALITGKSRLKTTRTTTDNDIKTADGLIPYEKPDSDEEDEDEDPTLINREKHHRPVYIRQLINGLRDSDKYDRQRLALSTASSLIRRKATFGTEVIAHLDELATILTGLQDKFDMENFQEWRMQSLISIVVAQPVQMGQWFSRAFFNGDYSIAQRTSILTAMGMGARELGGYKAEDETLTGAKLESKDPFPSKLLPENLHMLYAKETSPVNAIAKQLEKTMIQPMALEAADNLTGPNALKIRTFSSRMDVEKKRKKPIRNDLAKVVADGFFYPLTGGWWIQLKAYGTKSIYFSPLLLAIYLKTLAIILHASGMSTVSLPQMTSEFWDLALSLLSHPSHEPTVLEALLFAFLTILEINEDKRRLAEEHSRELLETQRWTELVFANIAGGDEEGDRLKMLAASVLIKTKEIVEKYHRLLIGDLI